MCTFKVGIHLPKDIFTNFDEGALKIMKSALYFMLKTLFALKIFTFLYWVFSYLEKQLDKKEKFNFRIYGVTDWTTNDYNKHINQYLKN